MRKEQRSIRKLIFLVSCFVLSACASRPTGYQSIEDASTTRGGFLGVIENGVFHDVLYGPESISLNFPGYIVGLNKGRHRDVGQGATYPKPAPNDSEGLKGVKERMQSNPKIHYISHVVRNEGNAYAVDNCVLYTVYDVWNGGDKKAGEPPIAACPEAPLIVGAMASAQADSSKALEALRQDVRRAVAAKKANAPYTHVVLMAMGWNTPQIEAVRNFNAIMAHIKRASGAQRFDPLFVGVTWPSVWTARWLDPAIKVVSYFPKADDADEVGTIWMSLIAQMLAQESPTDTRLVAIGHSFGARAVISSICSNDVWQTPSEGSAASAKPARTWDTFIGWQPAFSIKRFKEGGSKDGFVYPDGCLDRINTIVLTASANDEAVDSAVWAHLAGTNEAFLSVCPSASRLLGPVNCIEASSLDADSAATLPIVPGKINYIDASSIVFFNQPGTGGGAHSDVYRAVHGRVNWNAMNQAAQPQAGVAQANSR